MRNDYRVGRKVLHCVVEGWLHDRVRAAALADGLSITAFVVKVLEGSVDDGVGLGPADCVLSGAAGGVRGANGAGGGGGVAVGGVVGRGVDWDSIFAAGTKPVVEQGVVVGADEWLDIA